MTWRLGSRLAVVAWAAALGISCGINGLPLEHAQLFFWIVLGLAAFSLRAWRSWGRMVLEWAPLLGLLIIYDYLRGAVSVSDAHAHVTPQIDFDRWIGGGQVPTVWLQHHLYHPGHIRIYDVAIWLTYLSHFFTIWIVAALLWKLRHDRFHRYVATIVLITLMAFLTYWLYPAQPPWLAGDLGEIAPVDKIVPTVWGHFGVRTAADLFETGDGLVNLVAAMPSLHAAYPATLLLFFWRDGWRYRIGFGLYTLAMAFALVYGGEHFVADIVVGWLFAAVATGTVALGARALARRRTPAPAPALIGPSPAPSPSTTSGWSSRPSAAPSASPTTPGA
ncbi:MAG TPA: phosphatase PAP2 family protein [Baekduia sp.]